jgi:hypothetical protein
MVVQTYVSPYFLHGRLTSSAGNGQKIMKQPTIPSKVNWLARCRIDKCNKKRIKCPICKHYGHVVVHLVNGDIAKEVFQHSHFVEDQDGGRNIFHYTERWVIAQPRDIITKKSLTVEARKRIEDKFEGEYE